MRPLLLLILASTATWAQSGPPRPPGEGWGEAVKPPAGREPPTYHAGTALVRVDVLVLNDGQPLTGLRREDFVLREEGAPRLIEYFGQESELLEVLLLLDDSGSMGKLVSAMAKVARQALASFKPEDQVGVAVFTRHARIILELTTEKDLAARALDEAPLEQDLGAGTSINDSVLDMVAYFGRQPLFLGRRALVVLTDNGGVHYQLPDERVVRALLEAGTVLNAIVPPGAKPPGPPPQGPNVNPDFTRANVFRLAEETGGEVLRADKSGARLAEMLERIRARYSLGIVATAGPAGAYRRLQVDLSPEARRRFPQAQIRARAGYFTVGP